MTEEPYPFKPGDWVVDGGERVARVKGVSRFAGEVFLDLYIYSNRGDRIGRESPAMGGPRTYEPCCSSKGWERLDSEPEWPIQVAAIPNGDGTVTFRRWAGKRNPEPANYVPRKRPRARLPSFIDDDKLRKALKAIADGHNDPRALAKEVLGKWPAP